MLRHNLRAPARDLGRRQPLIRGHLDLQRLCADARHGALAVAAVAAAEPTSTIASQQVRSLPRGLPSFSLGIREAEANSGLRSDVKRDMRSGVQARAPSREGGRKPGTGLKGSRLVHLELRFAYAYSSRAIGVGGVCIVCFATAWDVCFSQNLPPKAAPHGRMCPPSRELFHLLCSLVFCLHCCGICSQTNQIASSQLFCSCIIFTHAPSFELR